MIKPKIQVLNNEFSIHRLQPTDDLPDEVLHSSYSWIGKTKEELSVVCEVDIKLKSQKCSDHWSAIKLVGPFDFSEIGILSDISNVLAMAGISIYAFSTYDTDYILIKKTNIDKAIQSLKANGYIIESEF